MPMLKESPFLGDVSDAVPQALLEADPEFGAELEAMYLQAQEEQPEGEWEDEDEEE